MSDEPDPHLLDDALLESVFSGEDNFVKARVHTSRHGVEGHDMHFAFRYLWARTVDKIREYGFRIKSVATESHIDGADFRVRVERTREPTDDELSEIDPDHYLLPDDYEP